MSVIVEVSSFVRSLSWLKTMHINNLRVKKRLSFLLYCISENNWLFENHYLLTYPPPHISAAPQFWDMVRQWNKSFKLLAFSLSIFFFHSKILHINLQPQLISIERREVVAPPALPLVTSMKYVRFLFYFVE